MLLEAVGSRDKNKIKDRVLSNPVERNNDIHINTQLKYITFL